MRLINRHINIKRDLCKTLVFALLLLLPVPVTAHKVMIFAWVEGDTIHTQSKFSGGKRTKNTRVLVYDPNDILLLEGKTDENGMFSFKIPKRTELKIVLKASMGHMAAWKIPVEEITGSQSESNILATVEEVTATSPSSSESIKIAGEVSEPSTMKERDSGNN